MSTGRVLDCLIVGGGPAGLCAATYLARYRRDAVLIDAGVSRCAMIWLSHNCPGWPDGVRGQRLLELQRQQARRYGARMERGRVERIERDAEGIFQAHGDFGAISARFIMLATGVEDIEPELGDVRDAIRRGLLRHCPICDAFEVIDKRVAVMGHGRKAINEALFMRHYTADVTLLTLGGEQALDAEDRRRAKDCGVRILEEPVVDVAIEQDRITAIRLSGGAEHGFDSLYSALGAHNRSELAVALGAGCTSEGAVHTDAHQQCSVDGMYVIGDVASSLNQIAVAWAHGAVAATDIHNRLRDAHGLRLPRPGQ
jgi:thioredoxin reductase (NADPH)